MYVCMYVYVCQYAFLHGSFSMYCISSLSVLMYIFAENNSYVCIKDLYAYRMYVQYCMYVCMYVCRNI